MAYFKFNRGDGEVNKRVLNIIGGILLLGMFASWIRFGYLDVYLMLLPVAYVCFTINDGSIKKLKKISTLQVILILFAFIVSVGIGIGLIQLANYLINAKLHLTGWTKTLSQFIAVIFSLYPVKFAFYSVVYKIKNDLNTKNIG